MIVLIYYIKYRFVSIFWLALLLMLVTSTSQSLPAIHSLPKGDSARARQWWRAGDSLYEESKYKKAETLLKKAQQPLKRTGQPKLYYSCLNMIANTLVMQQNFREGEKYLQKIVDSLSNGQNQFQPLLIEAYNSLGYLYRHAPYKNNQKAIMYYQKALHICNKEGVDDEGLLKTVKSNISSFYFQKGNMDKALAYAKKAVEVPFDSARTIQNAQAIKMVGHIYQNKGNLKKALENYKGAMSIMNDVRGEEYYGIGVIYANIGSIYESRRNFVKANDYYTLAKANFEKTLGNHPKTATAKASIGLNKLWLGENQEALTHLKNAKAIYDTLGLHEDRNYLSVLLNIATVHKKKGEYNKALAYSKENYQRLTHSQEGITRRDYMSLGKLGSAYRRVGKLDSARHFLQRYIDSSLKAFGPHHYEVADGYLRLAKLSETESNHREALQRVQKGLASCFPDFNAEGDIYQNPQLHDYEGWEVVFKLLTKKGELLQKVAYSAKQIDTANLKHAYQTFLLASRMIDTVETRYSSRKTVQFLYKNAIDAYAPAIEIGFQLHDITGNQSYKQEAYRLFGKNKSVLLRKNLEKSRARRFAGIPDSLSKKEKALQEDISFYQSQIQKRGKNALDNDKEKMFKRKLARSRQKLSTLKDSIRTHYPKYFQLMYKNQSLTLQELQEQVLRTNEAILEYFDGIDNYYYLFVTPDTSIKGHIPKDSSFQQVLSYMISSIKEPDTLVNRFVDKSHSLYKSLFGNIERLASKRTLHIIPDGRLVYLPFEILVQEKPDQNEFHYNMLTYMIRDYKVNYAYSNTLIRDNEKSSVSNSLNYIAFAPSFDSTNSPSGSSLAQLDGAIAELNALAHIQKGKKLQGTRATESIFKQEASSYDLIHMATHALVNEENPLNSSMILASNDSSTEDGKLNAWELFNMKLNAQLAVLSACNTGSGKFASGQGVVSLGRAFAYAGCPSLLISLWRVHDQVPVELMNEFYRSLDDGSPKHVALRDAKLDYLSSADGLTAHPFYWAGFMTIGNPDPIATSPWYMNTNYMTGGMIILILFLISGSLWWYRKNR